MNLIGESFDDFVGTQVNLRQRLYGSSTTVLEGREQYLYNKQPFIKLVSSVDITAEKLKDLGLSESLAGPGLAKAFVLFAGTSEFKGLSQNPDPKITGSDVYNFRAGLNINNDSLGNSAYGLGGLEFGQVPMPGITSTTVSYKNRGSLKTASISIKAYNKTQLGIIDALYLRLGYTVLLEWGWGANYLSNSGKVVPQIRRTLANGFLNDKFDSETILPAIASGRETLSGNYDALYGKITNFNWSFNPDGTYDITISLVSIGDIIESLTINDFIGTDIRLPFDEFESLIGKFKAGLRRAYKLGKNTTIVIKGQEIPVVVNKPSFLDFLSAVVVGGETPSPESDLKRFGRVETPKGNPLFTMGSYNDQNVLDYFTLTTGLVSSSPTTDTTDTTESKLDIISSNANINSLTFYLYKDIKLKIEELGIDKTNRVRILKSDDTVYAAQINWAGGSEENYYIKFSTLLAYIEKNLVYVNKKTKNNNLGVKAIKIDYNEEDNLIYINKYSVAADYSKVVTLNAGYPRLPDETKTINLLNGGLPTFISPKNKNAGQLMNVFLNIEWLSETIKSNIDEEGNVSLYILLQNICQGINSSLGNVNNLDVTIEEETNTIKFIDDKPIPNILKDFPVNNDIPTEFQVYAFSPLGESKNPRDLNGSFIRDFGVRTEVSNKLATTLSIGAQAVNAVVASNATALQSWNEGLTDRISPFKQMPNDKEETATAKYRTEIISFIDLLDKYDSKALNKKELPQLVGLNRTWQKFIEARIAEINKKASPSGIGFIPINLNLTMDGLSGMKIYQTFTINSKFLPLNYPTKLEFLIKGLSHNITSKGWETTIDTFSIPKDITSKLSSDTTTEPIIDKFDLLTEEEKKATAPFIYPVYNGVIRGKDDEGFGYYGAPRKNKPHEGIDLIIPTNKTITLYAPISGRITKSYPYGKPELTKSGWNLDQGFKITGQKGTEYEGYVVNVWYNVLNVQAGTLVNIGDPVAYSIYDMYSAYSKIEGVGGMTNHVHYEVKYNGKPIDPKFLIKGNNSLYKLVVDPDSKRLSPAEKKRLADSVRNNR